MHYIFYVNDLGINFLYANIHLNSKLFNARNDILYNNNLYLFILIKQADN